MKLKAFILFFFSLSICNQAQNVVALKYQFKQQNNSQHFTIEGKSRFIEKNGRMGINLSSILARIKLPEHTMNNPQGTVIVWIMPLEDIAPAWSALHMKNDYPNINTYSLLCDKQNGGNFADANFSFHINKIWHPGLTVKFKQGTGHDMYNHAAAAANHSDFEKLRWYQLSISWDLPEKNISLYINGVKVGNSDVTAEILQRDACGDTLYVGNPALVISEISFYNKPLIQREIYTLYREGATDFDSKYEAKLKRIYTGTEYNKLLFKPDTKWSNKLELSLQKKF